MLQQDYLFEWRTILENAVLGAEIQGADMTKARERATQLLTRYGLGQFLQPSAAPALRRHAPARGAGAHALHRAGRRAARRAVLGARFADAVRARRRGHRNPAPRGQDRDPGHARHRRGGQHGRAGDRAVAPARTGEVGPCDPLRGRATARARRRSRRATRPSSTAISTRSGRSSRSMSKVDSASRSRHRARSIAPGSRASGAAASPCAPRSSRLLAVFLVLWEVLPRAHHHQSAVHQLSRRRSGRPSSSCSSRRRSRRAS